jgi:potassium efflux system protein
VLNSHTGALRHARGFHLYWHHLALGLCLFLIALSLLGYHYTALRLIDLIYLSAWVGVGMLLLYHLANRWLLVAERRLALVRARARRQARQESRDIREAAEAAGESVYEAPDLEEVELDEINEQTRRLLRLGVVLFSAIGLFLIWSQLTPAFGRLDEWVLWEHVVTQGDKQMMAPVTPWDLLVALLVIVLTLVAGANLPGLLEIAVLQPLSVKPDSRYAVTNITLYLIYTAGFLLTVNMLGMRWGDVQWLVAAMGVGIGFGLQEIFANFISGIMILFERPIRIGDTVTVGEYSGIVSRIRIRATTITDFDNKELVIPNKSFVTDPLINWTLSDPITRVVINVGIAYGSDTLKAHKIMTGVIKAHPEVLDEPKPTVFFTGFGDSSLDFQIRVFVSERIKRMPLVHDIHMALDQALSQAGIEIPFPQRDLHLRSVDPDVVFRGQKTEDRRQRTEDRG